MGSRKDSKKPVLNRKVQAVISAILAAVGAYYGFM